MGSINAAETRISSGRSVGGAKHLPRDAVVNLDHGDPTIFEAFWREKGEKSKLEIPGWQTISYFSDVDNFCWFLEPAFAQEIKKLHKLVGNAVVEDRHIVVGTGSTQLFQAALYALSPPDAAEPMSVVSAVPYYSSYPMVTDYIKSALFRWAGDAHTFDRDAPYIELVTSPNNPDGCIRTPVVNKARGKTIHDLAYYWPQYTPITAPADHDLMLFTVSKCTGHAGARIGWALVKDVEVAKKMAKFIELNTIGVSKDSQLRAAKIMQTVREEYESETGDESRRFFDYSRQRMVDRWDRLRVAVKHNPLFILPQFPEEFCNFFGQVRTTHPAFAWLQCEGKDCESLLKGHKILTRGGKSFGEDSEYVRISMVDRDEVFDLLIQRLSAINIK